MEYDNAANFSMLIYMLQFWWTCLLILANFGRELKVFCTDQVLCKQGQFGILFASVNVFYSSSSICSKWTQLSLRVLPLDCNDLKILKDVLIILCIHMIYSTGYEAP